MESADILIVGQGLAGTVLARELLKKGLDVRIVDQGVQESSSWIAGGMMNPISPRRPTKGWRAEDLFPAAQEHYERAEDELEEPFFHPLPILRPFEHEEERERWNKNAPEKGFDRFLFKELPPASERIPMHPDIGGIAFQGAYLDLPNFLRATRRSFQDKGLLLEMAFDPKDLKEGPEAWEWKGIQARKLILCQGSALPSCPFFGGLPLRRNKGEILTLEMPEFPENLILNRGIYAIPLGNGKIRVGASYDHQDPSPAATEAKRQELLQRMEEWLPFSYKVLDQKAGFRPTTPDTRPYVGFHPYRDHLGLFNGMGSKGVLLAPYWAKEFAGILASDRTESPDPEVDPLRFKWTEDVGQAYL